MVQIQTLTMHDEEKSEKYERELADLLTQMEQLQKQKQEIEKEQKKTKRRTTTIKRN